MLVCINAFKVHIHKYQRLPSPHPARERNRAEGQGGTLSKINSWWVWLMLQEPRTPELWHGPTHQLSGFNFRRPRAQCVSVSLVRTAATLTWQGQLSVLGPVQRHPVLAGPRSLSTVSSCRNRGPWSLPPPSYFSHTKGTLGKSAEPEDPAQGPQTPPRPHDSGSSQLLCA